MTKLERFKAWLTEDKNRQEGLKNWEEILAKVDEEEFKKYSFTALLNAIKKTSLDWDDETLLCLYQKVVNNWEEDPTNQSETESKAISSTSQEEAIDWTIEFQVWLTQHPNDLSHWEKFKEYFLSPEGTNLELENIFWAVKEWDKKDGDLMEYWKIFAQWLKSPPACDEEWMERNDDYFNFLTHQGKMADYQAQIQELKRTKNIYLWIILLMVVIWVVSSKIKV